MKKSPELYTMDCFFVHETDKAILIIDPSSGERMWILLSHVEKITRNPNVDEEGYQTGKISMSAWIAKQKGLID